MKFRMKDWPVGVRVGVGFFTLNLGMIIVAVGGWWGLQQVQSDLRLIYEQYTVPSTKLVTVSTNLLRYRNSVIQAIGARNPEEFEEFSGDLPTVEKKIRTPLEEYASLYSTEPGADDPQSDKEPEPGSVEALNQALNDYFWLDDRTIKQATAGWKAENPEDRARLQQAAQQNGFFTTGPGLDQAASDLEAVLNKLRDQAAEVHQQSIETVTFATNMVLVVLAICTVLSVVLGVFIVKGVTSPLQALRDMFQELGEGNLRCQVEAKGQDELGQLCEHANRFVENLRTAIKQVSQATETVASASGELSRTSAEVKKGSQEQARQSEQAAVAVEEMSATSSEISLNTQGLCTKVEEANEVATQGGEVVRGSIAGMQILAQSIQQSAKEITVLGQRSEDIGKIIRVIEEIADQTNLLALNAAIEAARAGEQGRGFAVVADEVRKLAERTTKATKEITDVIKTIQATTNQAVVAMERGTQGVQEGVEKSHEAGTQLTRIVDDAKTLTTMVQQIAVAISQQSKATAQVSNNIQTVASVSQQNSTAVERVAQSSSSLSRMVDQLQSAVGQFRI